MFAELNTEVLAKNQSLQSHIDQLKPYVTAVARAAVERGVNLFDGSFRVIAIWPDSGIHPDPNATTIALLLQPRELVEQRLATENPLLMHAMDVADSRGDVATLLAFDRIMAVIGIDPLAFVQANSALVS